MTELRRLSAALSLLAAFAVVSYLTVVENAFALLSNSLRELGRFYLENAFSHTRFSSHSPEVVTAIVWNYRGFDTLFETFVFFLAIMGALGVLRLTREQYRELLLLSEREPIRRMDLIMRKITLLVVVMIAAISASIALHGHLTPGGGFQGGSALAVALLLLFAVFSKYSLERILSLGRVLVIYSLGIALIVGTALVPVLLGGNVLEINLLPGELGLFNLDVGEYIAVGMGFLAVFLVLGVPERLFKAILRGEVQ